MTAEVKPQFSPRDEAIYVLMDAISQKEEDVETSMLRAQTIKGTVVQMSFFTNVLTRIRLNRLRNRDLSKIKELEDSLREFNPALDSLVRDNNPRPTIALLEDQAEALRAHAKDEDAEKIQDLERLATSLSRAA